MSWAEIQHAVINAIERTRCPQSDHVHISYSMGYDAAKRDIVVAVAIAFAELEAKGDPK